MSTNPAYNKSLLRTIGEGSFFNTLDTVLGKILGFATVLLLLGTLGIFEYGLWILIKSVFDMVSSFMAAGLTPTILADLNREKAKGNLAAFKGIFLDALWWRAAVAAVLWVILYFVPDVVAAYYDNAIIPHIKTISFLVLFYPIKSAFSLLFRAHLRFDYSAYWSLVEAALYLGGVALFVFWWQMGVGGAVYAFIAANILSTIMFVPLFIKEWRPLARVERSTGNAVWQIMRAHGKWATLSQGVSTVDKNIYAWVIAYLVGVEAVAFFSVAKSLVGHLASAVPLSSVLAPIFPLEIENKERIKEIFFRSFKYSLYTFVVLAVGSAAAVPVFLGTFFPQYEPSLPLFYTMLPILFVSALSLLLNPLLNALRQQKKLFFTLLSRIALSLSLTSVLVWAFGIEGAAVAAVIVSFVMAAARYRVLLTVLPHMRIELKKLFVFDEFDKMLMARALSRVKR